jgi:ankyrin repeat protein
MQNQTKSYHKLKDFHCAHFFSKIKALHDQRFKNNQKSLNFSNISVDIRALDMSTPMHIAAHHDSVAALCELLSRGAYILTRDINGVKPVDFSLFHPRVKAAFAEHLNAKLKRRHEHLPTDLENLGKLKKLSSRRSFSIIRKVNLNESEKDAEHDD